MRPFVRAPWFAGLALAVGCASAVAGARPGEGAPPSDEQRARHTREVLTDARTFLQQERVDAAERALRRGLAVAPDEAQLHRLLARILARDGRADEARRHREVAEALDPPPPPLPRVPLGGSSRGIAVALLSPADSDEPANRVAGNWPHGGAAATLRERLGLRLPDATVALASPATVLEARNWLKRHAIRGALSLRVERSYCRDTIKDGPFAVAWLRVAGEIPGEPSPGPDERREVLRNPRGGGDCRAEALARALERALRHGVVRRTLAGPTRTPGARWSRVAIRSLFPEFGERIVGILAEGRAKLASGRVEAALETFRRAAQIDPDDPVVRAYVGEAEATLVMARELSARDPEVVREEDRGVLDPRFSPAQRAAAEARLAAERRRRDDLLAARAVLAEDLRVPPSDILASLRPGVIRNAGTFGPTTARGRTDGDIEVRVASAPDGSEIARYFFPSGGGAPLLRAEDIDHDGIPDRWIAYQDSTRRELWEDSRGSGRPDVHFVFARGGAPIERIEVDTDVNGRMDRVFEYSEGTLHIESTDTDGDGVLDRFDHLDAEGNVERREEDMDGDGEIDVISTYREGRLVDRSAAEPGFAPEDR